MQALEWTTIDKSEWGDGPWQSEPDKLQFVDEATGLPCLIVRGPSGALCGYVGVSLGHPYFEKGYSELPGAGWDDDIDDPRHIRVHGGLTYADHCQQQVEGDRDVEAAGICHVVEDGEDDNVWWFGFDCAHACDLTPKFISEFKASLGSKYRDVAYVKAEIATLAAQLKEVRGWPMLHD